MAPLSCDAPQTTNASSPPGRFLRVKPAGDRRGIESPRQSFERGGTRPMGSHHHSDRRQFLTESAALAGLAVGAVQSVAGQTPVADARLKDTLAYGQPSRFDTTLRKTLGAGSA